MKRTFKIIAILLICFMLLSGTVMASGSGGGTGGGQNDPLALVASSVSNGAKDVAVNTTIRMEFNKNVTFDTVRAGNASAFSLKDKAGNAVAVTVVLAESVNDAEKNFANIQFPGGLKAGTEYTLTVATSLESKSGDNLLAPVVITFTTKAASASGTTQTTTSNPKTGDDFMAMIVAFAAFLYVLGYSGYKFYRKRAN